MTDWGKIIRDIREDQGRSQREVAFTSGVHRSTLRRIEGGESFGDIGTIEELLAVLGYELDAVKVAAAMSDEALALNKKPEPEPEPKPKPKPDLESDIWVGADPVDAGRSERLADHRARYGD